MRHRLLWLGVAVWLTGCNSSALVTWQLDHPGRVWTTSGQLSATIEWDAVTDASSYNVYWATDPTIAPSNYDGLDNGGMLGDVASGVEVTGLLGGEQYYVIVTAFVDGVERSSPVVRVTPMDVGWGGVTPSLNAAWFVEGPQAGSGFGDAAYPVGDVNGDGYGDVAIGASGYSNGEDGEGAVFVFYGSATGLPATPDWTVESNQVGARMGHRVETAGDVNADGYADLIVGLQHWSNVENDEGAVHLYFGSADGLSTTPDWTFESDQDGAQLGRSIDRAGDINGDGFGDIVVGVLSWDDLVTPLPDVGAAFVFYGSATGPSATPDAIVMGDQTGSNFGWSVSNAGDVNGDGFDDLVVGAHGYDSAAAVQNVGRVYVYYGSDQGLDLTPAWFVEGDQENGQFGYPVTGSGADVNRDGYDDIVFGNANWDDGMVVDRGRVLVFYGGAAGLPPIPDWVGEGPEPNSGLGERAWLGDVNADGYADVLASADSINNQTGRALVYLGSDDGPSIAPSFALDGPAESSRFSASISCIDINGDGTPDMILGGPSWDTQLGDATGAAWMHFGAPTRGPHVIAKLPAVVRVGATFAAAGIEIDDPTSAARECTWNFGDGSTPEVVADCDPTTAVPHAYSSPGTYTAILTLLNEFGVSSHVAFEIQAF